MADILFYDAKSPYYEFSNYFQSSVIIDGREYISTEVYYQACKFLPQFPDYAEIIRTVNTSNKARYLALQKPQGGYACAWFVSPDNRTTLNDIIKQSLKDGVHIRQDWDYAKDNVMRRAVWAKFAHTPKLRDLLISTGTRNIVENSPRDAYWGIGEGSGKNMLGRILMEVRAFITHNFPPAPIDVANWLIPDVLMMSAYPGHADTEKHAKIVQNIVDSPINMIVSLMCAEESQNFRSYAEVVNATIPNTDSYRIRVQDMSLVLARYPIIDRSITTDQRMQRMTDMLKSSIGKGCHVLIHCYGGKGRTGTVTAILLGKIYGMTSNEALTIIRASFNTRKNKGTKAKRVPQTVEQIQQVQRILDT